MDDKLMAERRKILGEAVKSAKKALGIDVDELSRVQNEFDKKYDKLMPRIAKDHMKITEDNSKKHLKMLSARYAAIKKGDLGDRLTTIFPRCWCDFLDDFSEVNVCDHSVPIQDVDSTSNIDIAFDCVIDENKAKPSMLLKGGGDGVTNSAELVSRMAFNINDTNLTTKGKYCLTPTVLLSGYWLKENWAGCEGVTSTGDFDITLKMTASQLGGTKVLGELETDVFDWSSSDGYTGTIDKTYNVTGSTITNKFVLYPEIDPADGDVFIEIKLSIFMSMTGYGRFLVDMKNSNSFYFWVEQLELAKHTCLPLHCIPGGPDSHILCKIGGPDSIQCIPGGPDNRIVCRVGGPKPIACIIAGPNNDIHCLTGGPDLIPICKSGPDMGCNAGPAVGCLAGPPLDVVWDPEIWEKGLVTVDIEKIPNSIRRSVLKMLEEIKLGS